MAGDRFIDNLLRKVRGLRTRWTGVRGFAMRAAIRAIAALTLPLALANCTGQSTYLGINLQTKTPPNFDTSKPSTSLNQVQVSIQRGGKEN